MIGVDEINLEIRPDGTFSRGIFGCDFGDCEGGTWRAAGEGAELSASAGQELHWVVQGRGFRVPVRQLIVRVEDCMLRVEGTTASTHEAFVQAWEKGAVCVTSCGALSPRGTGPCTQATPASLGLCSQTDGHVIESVPQKP